MELFLIVWAGFAIVTAMAARSRGRDPILWFCVGLLYGPLGLVAVLVMKNKSVGVLGVRQAQR